MTIAADAELGQRELRLAAPNGLSNPLAFQVGQLTEFRKPEAKPNPDPQGDKRPQMLRDRTRGTPQPEMTITLPAVVNGQIMPGGVDRYRFQARNGQHLVVAVAARELRPYLADAVPGWFQAAVAIRDAEGNELAYSDHYRFHPDPVLYYKIPKDGQYVLEIHDSLYRGREDFVYRVTVGELPFVTGIFPLGGPAGKETTVELSGCNLHNQHADCGWHATAARAFFRSARAMANWSPTTCRLPSIRCRNAWSKSRTTIRPMLSRSRCR